MSKRLRVLNPRNFPPGTPLVTYPTGPPTVIAKLEKSGRHKLTDKELAAIKWKQVKEGEYCDDIPPKARKAFLRDGKIEEIDVKPRRAKKGKGK